MQVKILPPTQCPRSSVEEQRTNSVLVVCSNHTEDIFWDCSSEVELRAHNP